MAKSPRRHGFTLVELLVVIAIIVLLMSLLMPAIQKVRAASDKMLCANNLKQIGIALHNFHIDYDRFPPGYMSNQPYVDGASDTSPGWGWSAYLLPYIESDNVYRQIRFDLPIQDSRNAGAVQTFIKPYICPSDLVPSGPFTITSAGGGGGFLAAPSSYAATCGPDESEVDAETGLGVFYRNSKTRIADIHDGSSNTVLIGDRAWAMTNGSWVGAPSRTVCRAGTSNPWTMATGASPTFVLVHNNWINILTDADGGLDDFSSFHPGGVNLLFGDGAVHFLPSITSDGQIRADFWALGTRSGGELVLQLDY